MGSQRKTAVLPLPELSTLRPRVHRCMASEIGGDAVTKSERESASYLARNGDVVIKMTAKGNPDFIVIPEAAKPFVHFVEVKCGEKPKPHQQAIHDGLRTRSLRVTVLNRYEKSVDAWVRCMLKEERRILQEKRQADPAWQEKKRLQEERKRLRNEKLKRETRAQYELEAKLDNALGAFARRRLAGCEHSIFKRCDCPTPPCAQVGEVMTNA